LDYPFLPVVYYETPCRRGHIGWRRGSKDRARCPHCERITARDWYSRNKAKVAEQNRRYRQKNPERRRAQKQRWQRRNMERVVAYNREWRRKNPDKAAAHGKKWRDNNGAVFQAIVRKRQATVINRTPKWADHEAMKQFYLCAKRMEAATGIKHHVDHIVPLQGRDVCGLHVEANLQVLPANVNLRKADRWAA
jgi:hypothetical protein